MEASYRVVGFLGKMCKLCAACEDRVEKTLILAEIGSSFLKYEDYFAVALERELVPLEKEYNQFQRFFEEASDACLFKCNSREALINLHAMDLINSISCNVLADESIKKVMPKVTKIGEPKNK